MRVLKFIPAPLLVLSATLTFPAAAQSDPAAAEPSSGRAKPPVLAAGEPEQVLVSARKRGKVSAPNSVMQQVFADCGEAVRDTLAGMDEAKVNRIGASIAAAERLYLFGAGGSAHIAQVAALNFLSLGLQTISFVDPIQQLAAAKLASPRDVAVAVTYSGNQSDVAEALRTARKKGAFCVGITSFEQSLISKWANELLLMFIPAETLRGQAGAHRVAQIALLDALAVCVGKFRTKRNLVKVPMKGASSK